MSGSVPWQWQRKGGEGHWEGQKRVGPPVGQVIQDPRWQAVVLKVQQANRLQRSELQIRPRLLPMFWETFLSAMPLQEGAAEPGSSYELNYFQRPGASSRGAAA